MMFSVGDLNQNNPKTQRLLKKSKLQNGLRPLIKFNTLDSHSASGPKQTICQAFMTFP